jgi:chorismate mutase
MTDFIAQTLKPFRKKIDDLDDQLVDLLVEREKIIREVAVVKAQKNIAPVLQERIDEVRERNVARGIQQGADENYIREIYTKIIQLSCALEETIAKSIK